MSKIDSEVVKGIIILAAFFSVGCGLVAARFWGSGVGLGVVMIAWPIIIIIAGKKL